jgi:hypothetical protein
MLSADAHGNGSGPVLDRYIAMAIQGDLQQASRILQSARSDPSSEHLDLAGRFQRRFVQRSEPLSPNTGIELVDQAVAAYRDYWARSLLAEPSRADGESMLEDSLHRLLKAGSGSGEADDVYHSLGKAIEELGYGILAITAPPLQDLFIWGSQREQEFTVKLTDQSRIVQVAFMSDFVSLGWKDYAALGLATTTGWVEDGVLYCVERAYIAGTERFEVSYLKHEARHLADLERFPRLRSVDLEYRAKLTELAFASQTLQSLLDDFAAKSAPNPGSPHAEANLRVLQDLHEDLYGRPLPQDRNSWRSVRSLQVNAAARRLLRENTDALEALHAEPAP